MQHKKHTTHQQRYRSKQKGKLLYDKHWKGRSAIAVIEFIQMKEKQLLIDFGIAKLGEDQTAYPPQFSLEIRIAFKKALGLYKNADIYEHHFTVENLQIAWDELWRHIPYKKII